MTAGELIAALKPLTILTGDIPERLISALRESGPDVDIVCEAEVSRAAALGRIAIERLERAKPTAPPRFRRCTCGGRR